MSEQKESGTGPLVPTILCGGVGSRLWPVSRAHYPKPFIRLADGQSLLQKALLRGAGLPGVAEIQTVTNRELFFNTVDEYTAVAAGADLPATSFILEPCGRNTAAAVAVAALRAARVYGEAAILLVLAADHLIADQDAFAEAVARARALAAQGRLVTFGIAPDRPETGYGYIEAAGDRVLRFIEKPSREQAESYLAAGRFYWNSGMFAFAAGVVLEEMARCSPAILAACRQTLEHSAAEVIEGDRHRLVLDAESFAAVPADSIDYAVMERSDRLAVVPCSIGWSDIGSWTALAELDQPDAAGNRCRGEVVARESRDCVIHGQDRLIGTLGIDNLIVVDTPDALLVANRQRAQEVKALYGELVARRHPAAHFHSTVHRPWGTYTVLEQGEGFKIKRIEVKPGATLSLQMHHHRSEHWVVVSGMARVINGEREYFVNTNESTYIPAGCRHRLENPGMLKLVMIEVQSGAYLGEDDIVRFEDDYGRL